MNRAPKILLLLAFIFLTPIYISAQCEYTSKGKPLTKKEKKKAQADAPFIEAIESRDLPKFKELLEKGADVNARDCESGSSALINSIILNEWEMFKILLEKKADVNAKNYGGLTALMYAA